MKYGTECFEQQTTTDARCAFNPLEIERQRMIMHDLRTTRQSVPTAATNRFECIVKSEKQPPTLDSAERFESRIIGRIETTEFEEQINFEPERLNRVDCLNQGPVWTRFELNGHLSPKLCEINGLSSSCEKFGPHRLTVRELIYGRANQTLPPALCEVEVPDETEIGRLRRLFAETEVNSVSESRDFTRELIHVGAGVIYAVALVIGLINM